MKPKLVLTGRVFEAKRCRQGVHTLIVFDELHPRPWGDSIRCLIVGETAYEYRVLYLDGLIVPESCGVGYGVDN